MFRKLHDFSLDRLTIFIDGISVTAERGESVAAVLLRQKKPWSRSHPVSEGKRAPYCMMGVCFECLAEIDGVPSTQTCLTPVKDGMRIRRQIGKRSLNT